MALLLNGLLLTAQTSCVSCVGNVSSPNLVANGSFTNGNTGFLTELLYSTTGCGTGKYGLATDFPTFCSGWGPLSPHSGPNFLALDGANNGNVPTVLWQTPVNLTTNTDYCFSFYWALAFAHPSQNFPISIDIVDVAGVPLAGRNLGTQTIATNLTWTNASLMWNTGTLPTGNYFIAIRQLTGSLFRDWAIDDICFTKKVAPCDAAFTSAAVGSCGNYQFTNTSTPTTGLTYDWLFNDTPSGVNNTSALQNPTHQFTTCGTYNVRLIITGTECRDTVVNTVTVVDNTPPVITCPANKVVNCLNDTTTTITGLATATDNCPNIAISYTNAIVGVLPCDYYFNRTWTARDACGNTTTCQQAITISNTAPVITCPANVTVQCNVTTPSVTGIATAVDACGGSPLMTFADVVTGNLPCNGTIQRTWTAKGLCRSSTCVQTIVVRDNTPPIITNCLTNQTVNTNLGQCYYTFPTLPTITAIDNCDPTPSVSYTYINSLGITLPFTTATQFPKGLTSIGITARDACGNVSQACNFILTVVDNELPKITCPQNIVVVGTTTPPPAAQCKAIINGLAPTATDNCPMLNVNYTIMSVTNGSTGNGLTDASGFNFMGTSTLSYTVTDMAGNTASCNSTVTVRCDSCGCGSGGTLSQNLIANGNFALGNVGFTSGLTYDNNTGCVGTGNRYTVRNSLPVFCGSWANTTARTQPNCLILDGSETSAAVLWKNQSPFNLTQGAAYCFSFWWTSAYDSITQPSFPIQVDIVDASGNVVAANIGTQNIAQLPTGVWVNKTIAWTSNLPTGGGYYAVIRQLGGGLFRDFAIDDICFTRASPPPTCSAEFSSQANGCGKYTFNGFASGTGPYTYTWNFDDPTSTSNVITGTSTTNAFPVQIHQFAVGGLHTVTLTITDATGCTKTFTSLITVPTLPKATITGNLSVCSGQSTTLTASGGGTYQWLPNGQITAAITVTPTVSANTYSAIVTDVNGCKDTARVTVTIKPIPAFLLPNQTICQGQSATLTAAGGGTYAWTPGGQTTASITVTPSVSTTYTCVVTGTNGCTGTNSAAVTVNPKPTATITGNQNLCQGQSTTLTASGGGTYQWLPSNQATASITISPSVSTTYTLITTSASGCKDTTLVSIKVISCGCPDSVNLVKNGSFESGTPNGSDESIGLATNWGRIWPAPYGQSTADFWNTGVQNPTTGIGLTTPTPASQNQFAGFWVHNTTALTWREGILSNTLSTVIAQNSGIYDLSLKLACLDNSIAGASLSVFGVPTGATSALSGTNPLTGNTPLNANLFNQSAILLATYPIPTGCNAAFTTIPLQFNANILPSQGIDRIFLTRTDAVSGKAYLAIDDICLQRKDTCISPNLLSGLTGYFPFNGNANDVSPTAINGVATSVTQVPSLNTPSSAYGFNGTSSWIDCTNNTRSVTSSVSVAAWVKTTEPTNGMWIAGQYNGPSQAKGYLLSIGDVTNASSSIGLPSFSGRVDNTNYYSATSTTKVNDGKWHCLVGTAGQGVNGVTEWKIYVDGVLKNTQTGVTTPNITPTATPFTIGRHSDLSIGTMFFKGDMDDVRVYSRVLSVCEIDSLCSIRLVSGVKDKAGRLPISIFPNPNSGTFTVELPVVATESMLLRVTDLLGKVVLSKKTELGKETQTIQTFGLPDGLYFLQVISEGKVIGVEKFVKQ